MFRRLDVLPWLLAAIVLGRLLPMAMVPMIDTTEPRYAEIARIMAETGDWITPWFDYGVPFWGKPPLSFWSQAISFRLFGVTEFTARLPSWLANLGILALIYTLVRNIAGHRQALIGALGFSTMALSYVMSGAVLTDPFFALGTTLSLVSILLAIRHPASLWRWGFFCGLSIGLLAKGPLAFILIGGPLFLWVMWRRQWRDLFAIPWLWGMLLTALLSLPWYIVAELKTPGFISYFIVGEHFLRFVDSGWAGDLYGYAHKQAYGTIWLYWVWATFPWGPVAIVVLVWHWVVSKKFDVSPRQKLSDEQRLMLLAALFPGLFFTFSGNILWTYQLPALAPLAILLATWTTNLVPAAVFNKWGLAIATVTVPIAVMFVGFYTFFYPDKFGTEKTLVEYYDQHKGNNHPPLIYVGKPPFSARFYSKGQVTQIAPPEVVSLMNTNADSAYFLAVRNKYIDNVIHSLPGKVNTMLTNRRFTLLQTMPTENKSVASETE